MSSIWNYTKKYRIQSTKTNQSVRKGNGQLTQNDTDEMQRWEEWLEHQFYNQHQLKLKIAHITEEQWAKMEQQIQT